MVRLVISGDQFNEILTPLSTIAHECRVTISPDGLFARVVDVANCILSEISLSPRYFKEFSCDEPADLLLDVILLGIIRVKKTDELVIETEPDPSPEGRPWLIISTTNKTFRFRMLSNDEVPCRPEPAHIQLTHTFCVEQDWFAEAVTNISKISDLFIIGPENGTLIARSRQDDERMCSITLPSELCEGDPAENVKSAFDTDYIKQICKICRRYRKLTVSINNLYPIRVHVPFLGQDPDSYITLLLAPKTEGDAE